MGFRSIQEEMGEWSMFGLVWVREAKGDGEDPQATGRSDDSRVLRIAVQPSK
jgi:hypothetical protein